MVSVGATTPQRGTSTRGKNPPQGGAAHGARAHHRGAHNTAGGPQGGTTRWGAPAHRGAPPTRQHPPHRESSLAASEGRGGAKTGGGKKPAETAPALLLELVDIYWGYTLLLGSRTY